LGGFGFSLYCLISGGDKMRSLKANQIGYTEKHRRNCCYSVALATLYDLPIEVVDRCFRDICRPSGGMSTNALESIICKLTGKPMNYLHGKITLGQFIKCHKKGRFYLHIKGHALAIIDGQLFDRKNRGKNCPIRSFAEIET
jgi:hypothetical protein